MIHTSYNQQEILQVSTPCESILSVLWYPLYFTLHCSDDYSAYWLSSSQSIGLQKDHYNLFKKKLVQSCVSFNVCVCSFEIRYETIHLSIRNKHT